MPITNQETLIRIEEKKGDINFEDLTIDPSIMNVLNGIKETIIKTYKEKAGKGEISDHKISITIDYISSGPEDNSSSFIFKIVDTSKTNRLENSISLTINPVEDDSNKKELVGKIGEEFKGEDSGFFANEKSVINFTKKVAANIVQLKIPRETDRIPS